MLLSIFFSDFILFNLLWNSSLGQRSVFWREGAPTTILGSIFLLLSPHSYNSSKVRSCSWELLEYLRSMNSSTFKQDSCFCWVFLLARAFYLESNDLSSVLSYRNRNAPDFLLIIGNLTIGFPNSKGRYSVSLKGYVFSAFCFACLALFSIIILL